MTSDNAMSAQVSHPQSYPRPRRFETSRQQQPCLKIISMVILHLGTGQNKICMKYIVFKKYIFYLFIFREKGRQGERGGVKHQCVVAPCATPHLGPGLQPRHVPCLGIELATPWFTGPCPIH